LSGAPADLLAALEAELGDRVTGSRAVAGGDINDAWRVELASGEVMFVKSRGDASRADFEAEAAGLGWLARTGAVAIPRVLGHGGDPAWLALEWIERGSLSPDGAEELGRGLARLHRAGAEAHGALPEGAPDSILRLGSVELPIEPAESWPELYRGQLIVPLLRRAVDAGRIAADDGSAIEGVVARLDSLSGPEEPPARLHGDLWSGNVLADAAGAGWLIDPAAYGGHREVDLAMLRLFGAPSRRIFAAYDEAFPLADGHGERVALFQVLPLLVHAVLFGGSYGAAAARAARGYL
jgi:fructosamine-3-kinase